MQFIKSIASLHIPDHTPSDISVLCISTTNPVYLVFSKNEETPKLVIRDAEPQSVRYAHEISEKLFSKVGTLISEPIGIIEYANKEYSIQKGLKGTPWFQLTNNITSKDEWERLSNRALSILNQLHDGIFSTEQWKKTCRPGDELRQCYSNCIKSGTNLSQEVKTLVEDCSKELDNLGEVSSFHQHGDFCLNNLIVDNDLVHVIDFEDFGMTSMPLHDEISLALSLYSQAPQIVETSLKNEIISCTKGSLTRFGISGEFIPGFFLYHLLLRLGDWSQGGRRDQYREWLFSVLGDFTNQPELYKYKPEAKASEKI